MKTDPLAIVGDREVADAVRGVVRQPRRLAAVDIERPEAGGGRLGIPDPHIEALVEACTLVLVHGVRGDEIDPLRVGRPLPQSHTSRLMRDLHRPERVTRGDRRYRYDVELLLVGTTRPIDQPLSVLRERER